MPQDQRSKRDPCITALGGTILIQGCEFRDHKPQVYLGPGLRGAIVSNNIMHWPVDIRSDMKQQAIVKDDLGLPPAHHQK